MNLYFTYNNLKINLTIALLLSLLFVDAQTISDHPVYSKVNSDTLVFGNSLIEYTFLMNSSNMALHSIFDKETQRTEQYYNNLPLFYFGAETNNSLSLDIKNSEIHSERSGQYTLVTELLFKYKNLWVKQIITIISKTKALEFEFQLLPVAKDVTFSPEETVLFQTAYKNPHLHYTSIEFVDQTDIHNTLVYESNTLGFTKPAILRGNLLIISNPETSNKLWLLKKAPCSGVQLHYPGFDFEVMNTNFSLVGAGIIPEDLTEEEWTPSYGVVLGSPVLSELDYLINLRTYQKNQQTGNPELMEMIMMNTWGDRNRDANINEAFIRKEIDACKKLGITHFQIDDGWQQGKSMNSADVKGELWDAWDAGDWQPSEEKFPGGFNVVAEYAKANNIQLGIWFNPSKADEYSGWERDARIISNLYNEYGIRHFKIDGIDISTKRAEVNLRKFYKAALDSTNHSIVFNIDATAGNRGGYFFLNEHGNIFLENRYTDWANYYPYQTLRNLWMLSKYVPPEKLQIEFLNKWRNKDKYLAEDPLKPYDIPFDYLFAITMMGQPLAWFEGSSLPPEAMKISKLIMEYQEHQEGIHSGLIFPIGDEPNGTNWSGFQSIKSEEGYMLIFRENNSSETKEIWTYENKNIKLEFEHILGHGKSFTASTSINGGITFSLPQPNTFALYRYNKAIPNSTN